MPADVFRSYSLLLGDATGRARLQHDVGSSPPLVVDEAPFATASGAILSNQNVAGAQHECFFVASSEFEGAAQSKDVLALRRVVPMERRMWRRFLELWI